MVSKNLKIFLFAPSALAIWLTIFFAQGRAACMIGSMSVFDHLLHTGAIFICSVLLKIYAQSFNSAVSLQNTTWWAHMHEIVLKNIPHYATSLAGMAVSHPPSVGDSGDARSKSLRARVCACTRARSSVYTKNHQTFKRKYYSILTVMKNICWVRPFA